MAYNMTITVTPEELVNQSGQVNSAAKDLKESYDTLKRLVRDSSRFWQGEAADTHREGFEQQQEDIEEIIARYLEHVRDLQTMAGVYAEAEAAAETVADELPPITF